MIAGKVDRVTVYHQFNYNTKNITTLEPYFLDPNSLFVDGMDCLVILYSNISFWELSGNQGPKEVGSDNLYSDV